MTQKITGISLFLRYAWPCAEDRLSRGLITRQEFDRLQFYIKSNTPPPVTFLLRCFPGAFNGLITFARKNGKDPWDVKTVQEFWRYHHGHKGLCEVRLLTVMGIKGNRIQTGIKFPVINMYGLDLEPGNLIFIHRLVAVEKLEI